MQVCDHSKAMCMLSTLPKSKLHCWKESAVPNIRTYTSIFPLLVQAQMRILSYYVSSHKACCHTGINHSLRHGLAGSANTAQQSDELRHRSCGGFPARNSPRAVNLEEKWRRSYRKRCHFSSRGDDKNVNGICRSG
jgi:hypothetical protein